MLTHLSLFSGIGGFDIAAEWAGFRTVCFVEIDPFCQKVLRKHWPDVPLIEDINDFDGAKYRGAVDLITAGVPCQPISTAGERKGEEDDRWLWPETIRVLSEVRPAWACFENPIGLLSMGINSVLTYLDRSGYQSQTLVIPACAVGAPHRRDRVWIVAYNHSFRCGMRGFEREGIYRPQQTCHEVNTENQTLADSASWRLQGLQPQDSAIGGEACTEGCKQADRFEGLPKPRIWHDWPNGIPTPFTCGGHDGIQNRAHRTEALGNSIVPQQVYPILKAIADTYGQAKE